MMKKNWAVVVVLAWFGWVAGCKILDVVVPTPGPVPVPTTTTTTSTSTTTTTIPVVPVVGGLIDPSMTAEELDNRNGAGDREEVRIEAVYKIIFRGHTKRPSVNGWWTLSTPWIYKDKDGKDRTVIQRVGNDVIVPDVVFRDVVYQCVGWCKDEPQKGNLNPRLDYVGNKAPWGTKHAIIECRKPVVK